MPGLGGRPGRGLAAGSIETDSVFQSLRHPDGLHDFHLDDAEALALTLFLGRDAGSRSLRRLRERHSSVDADAGRRIFIALNCAGCHAFDGIDGRPVAPLLAFEGSRVGADWLRRFLLDPAAIRPFGAAAGPGARMPDPGLSESDADSLVAFLLRRTTTLPEFQPATLSPFDREKATTLLETRFSCLGCHAWNGRGGRIAPDLAGAATRLEPAWVRAMLESPDHLVPGTIMPPAVAPAVLQDLIAALLVTNEDVPGRDTVRAGYLSLIENAPSAAAWRGHRVEVAAPAGREDYSRFCASCHGDTGRGDGYNARFLRVRPADHTDASAMALRSDDVLYDAIAAGGRFLDRSPEMPGFSGVLEPAAIRGLVAHIRTLCSCEGPAWSRDGTRP
jgi:mono/diheme cytochrome c family protein